MRIDPRLLCFVPSGRPVRRLMLGVACAIGLATVGVPGSAEAASGQFTYVIGSVYVESGNTRIRAQRGTEVNPGDRIVTEADGMAQLSMIDDAKLSLRSNSQLVIESYQRRAGGSEGAVLSLVRGTLRTFTGLLSSVNREKYQMKTRVATVGIRGSGNIMSHEGNTTINHTIEGSHTIKVTVGNFPTVVTGPNDTYKVETGKPPEKIPTPPSILVASTQMTEKKPPPAGSSGGGTGEGGTGSGGGSGGSSGSSSGGTGSSGSSGSGTGGSGTGGSGEGGGGSGGGSSGSGSGSSGGGSSGTGTGGSGSGTSGSGTSGTGSGTSGSGSGSSGTPTNVGINIPTNIPTGTGTATSNSNTGSITPVVTAPQAPVDPQALRDIVMTGNGATYSGAATQAGMTLEAGALRGFTSIAGYGGTNASVAGGTAAGVTTVDLGSGSSMTFGRWVNPTTATAGGLGTLSASTGNAHFIYGNSGFPVYFSDVLTGTVTYTNAGATTPTNQNGVAGTLTSATLAVNFSQRTLNTVLAVALGTTNWTLQGSNVPFTINGFFATNGYGLTVTNNTTNQSSSSNPNIGGQIEGSFVGATLNGLILGYGFTDFSVAATRQQISGVVGFRGDAQNPNAPFRIGMVSDPTGSISQSAYSRSFTTVNRPEEVTTDTTGRASAFAAGIGSNGLIAGWQPYTIGTAQALDVGTDAASGLSWGRWSGGAATVGGANANLANRSLHYIFAASQAGPTTLPQTGTVTYELAGSTRPTDNAGNVGTLNTATLNANFTARTVDTSVNLTIANQTWTASATGVPIIRDLTFAANTGGAPAPGLPAPTQLTITCTPTCGNGLTGSIDGFFTGRTGQGAATMYNLNSPNRSVSGAVAFRRPGG